MTCDEWICPSVIKHNTLKFLQAEFFTGKLSITEGFSITMFDYRRVFDIICVRVTDPSIIFQPASIEHRAKDLNQQYPNSSRNTRNTLYRCAVQLKPIPKPSLPASLGGIIRNGSPSCPVAPATWRSPRCSTSTATRKPHAFVPWRTEVSLVTRRGKYGLDMFGHVRKYSGTIQYTIWGYRYYMYIILNKCIYILYYIYIVLYIYIIYTYPHSVWLSAISRRWSTICRWDFADIHN